MNRVDTGNSYLLLWDIDSSLSDINHSEAMRDPGLLGLTMVRLLLVIRPHASPHQVLMNMF